MKSVIFDRGDPLDHRDVLFEWVIGEDDIADGEFRRHGYQDHIVRLERWTHRVAGDPDSSKAPEK